MNPNLTKGSVRAYAHATFVDAVSVLLMIFAFTLASSGEVEAHHHRKSTDKTSGISIPNLRHGQLHVMRRYEPAILDLASRQVRPSIKAQTLQNFVNLQYAYCLWGLVPGSLLDEANPFNECSHAYLAASKLLLDQLRQTEETRARADILTDQINSAMLQDATAIEICSNSFEPFNTAQIVMPEWANMTFNPLGVLLGSFVLAASAGVFGVARGNRKTVHGAH